MNVSDLSNCDYFYLFIYGELSEVVITNQEGYEQALEELKDWAKDCEMIEVARIIKVLKHLTLEIEIVETVKLVEI